MVERIGGLGSGLDTQSIIDKLMSIERRPLIQLQEKKVKLEKTKDAWRDINTRLAALQTKISDLKLSGTFNAKAASGSDDRVFSASAGTAASLGAYSINVAKLAKAHSVASDVQVSATTSLNQAGTIQINGKSVTIGTADTLNDLRDKINNTIDIKVSASVVAINTNQYQLVLTAKETGSAKAITYADDNNVLLNLGVIDGAAAIKNEIQGAQDAEFKVNNLTIYRSTNTFSDVIDGVSITLKGTSADALTNATLQVIQDTGTASKAVQAFVDQYNSAMALIKEKLSYNSTTKAKGDLMGDATLMQIQRDLRNMVGGVVNNVSSAYNNMATVGIKTTSSDSKLTLDTAKLSTALTEHLDDVIALFGASKTNLGIAAGTSISASSEFNPSFAASSAADGRTSSDQWGNNGGWNDATSGDFTDDWLQLNFNGPKAIDEFKIFTLDSAALPATTYGLKDFDVEYWAGSEWKNIKSYTGNILGVISHTFDAITTDKIRVKVNAANGANDFARIVEFQAYAQNDGLASRMHNKVTSLTTAGTGTLDSRQKSLDTQIKDIDKSVEKLEDRLVMREESLWRQFTALEKVISKMNTQSQWLTSQLANMPSTSNTNNNK